VETPARTVYRFGPFEADTLSGELLKQGKRIRLQEQPFRLLVILIEHAGEVVSKAEIQRQIWNENTFVDFDSSLRVAVAKLREALGDDAGNPHYIESIPKRGYRFLGQVAFPVNPPDRESAGPLPLVAVAPASKTTKSSRWILAGGLLLLVLVADAAYVFVLKPKKVIGERDMVVLADFENKTGDAVFDDTLRQGLAVQLEQSPFLSLVSDDRIQQIVQMMGRPAQTRLTPSIAREICERAGGAAVLNGSIAQIGSQYLLTLKVVNCLNGESLASAEAQAGDKNHVLEALGKMSSEIRKKLGESLSSVQKLDTPIEQASTPSLAALKAFTDGQKVLAQSGDAASIPFFQHAVELDPDFALAYAYLGIVHTTIGEPGIGAAYTRKAFGLRERTSEPENYLISATYFKEVTGDLKTAERTCTLWSHAYPRSEKPHTYLSGAIFPQIGWYEKAIEEGKAAVLLNPDSPIPYAFLMFGFIGSNRFEDAKTVYQQALERKLDSPFFHQGLYQIAFVQNDAAEMARQAAWSESNPGAGDPLLMLKAESAAYTGRLQQARETSEQASDSAERAGENEAAAGYIAQSALREALFGNVAEARTRARMAIKRSSGRDVQYGAALTLAFAGESTQVLSIVNDLSRRFPEDTIVQSNYLPTLRGILALNQGKTGDAIDRLEVARTYELGGTTGSSYGWNALYPAFVRGQAYLRARKGVEAAAEFQKILDHRGVVVNEPIGALAHLGLARAYALQGEKTKLLIAYEDFFALWKAADPDIPVIRRAKTEYEKLR
jgi:DNA-binding winged helix-turn-helix (wHTH) protein/tetratricopeptide (TPR) repeat protein